MHIGTYFRIPVYLHWTVVLLMAFIAYPSGEMFLLPLGLFLAVVVPVIVLLHELGHALTAQACGVRVRSITLFGLGGMAKTYGEGKTIGQRLAITAAGPAVNIALAFLGITLHIILLKLGFISADNMFLIGFWGANLILGIFNLVPAFPMDGGRLLRTGLSKLVGYVKATKIATELSLVLSVLAIMYGLFTFQLILVAIAAFVIFAANSERKKVGLKTFF